MKENIAYKYDSWKWITFPIQQKHFFGVTWLDNEWDPFPAS